MLLQWEQSGDTDLLLLNEPEEGGYEGNFLDPHLDALGGIVTATDDQKGSDSRLLEQSHRSGGQLRHSVRSWSKWYNPQTPVGWSTPAMTPSLSLFSLGCENLPQSSAKREPVRSSAV
jgi:hypothetical protein